MEALGLVLGIIGVLAFAAGALAWLKNAVDKATIDTLTKNAAALTDRVRLLEASDARKTAEIADLRHDRDLLLAQRPSAEAIAEIDRKLTEHHTQTMHLLEANRA